MTDYSELKRLVKQGSLPPIVSTLIAENERYFKLLEHMVDGCLPVEGMKDLPGYSRVLTAEKLLIERDQLFGQTEQLKAEVEALRKDLESHKRMLLDACVSLGAIGEAMGADSEDDPGELEGLAVELRKDADRYRWLKASDWYVGSDNFHCSEGGILEGYSNENFSPDDLDATIDAAMSKDEQP